MTCFIFVCQLDALQRYVLLLFYTPEGVEKGILRAKTCVYWPNISKDIEKIVKGCLTCSKYQSTKEKETLISRDVPFRSWQTVGADLYLIGKLTY